MKYYSDSTYKYPVYKLIVEDTDTHISIRINITTTSNAVVLLHALISAPSSSYASTVENSIRFGLSCWFGIISILTI